MNEFKKFVVLDVILIVVWAFFLAELGKGLRPDNVMIELSGAICGASVGFCIGLAYKVLINKINRP